MLNKNTLTFQPKLFKANDKNISWVDDFSNQWKNKLIAFPGFFWPSTQRTTDTFNKSADKVEVQSELIKIIT